MSELFGIWQNLTETDNILIKGFSIFSPHGIPEKNFVCQILSDFFEFFGPLESELPKVFEFQLMSDSVSNAQFELQIFARSAQEMGFCVDMINRSAKITQLELKLT